jgi:DNA binding domain, excisionase family
MVRKSMNSENEFESEYLKTKMLTSKEAAYYLSISVQHLRRLSRNGKIVSYKPGGKNIYYDINDLDNYQRNYKRMNEEEIIRRTSMYHLKKF